MGGGVPLHQRLTSVPTPGVSQLQMGQDKLCLWGRCLETSTAWCLEKSQETGSSQDRAFRCVRGSGGQRRHCRWNHREAA